MAKHRSYSVEFKRQVVQDYLTGETLHGIAKRHDISRNLIRIWIAKHEAGALDSDIMAHTTEICAEFPRYGYRRITAQLREDGIIVNHKKVMRLMKEHGLTVQPRRRYVVTTDSDHDGPIFPNLAKEVTPTGPNQLWVADITYIAIARGFVYLAAILDAWSRRVVGYAIGRRIDARLTLAALQAAVSSRAPPRNPSCNCRHDPTTQVFRVRSSHPCWPPPSSQLESHSSIPSVRDT